jgi:hypothetical protein
MKRFMCLVSVGFAWAMAAAAQAGVLVPVVDGKVGALDGYPAALSVQNTNTQYGDAATGDPVNGGGGSEIDQVFATVVDGRLYVTVTGNLEWNFNKINVFIDSKPGGVNSLDGANLPTMVDGYCCTIGGGTNLPNPTDGALQRLSGLTFDAGFDADYYLAFTNGPETVNPNMPDSRQFWAISAHYADLTNGTAGAVVPAGVQLAPRGLPNVMRFPGDYNKNGKVDGTDSVIWRNTQGQAVARGAGADADGSMVIDQADFDIWRSRFDDGTTLADFSFVPFNLALGVSEALVGPALPGLAQGQLIDRTYAQGSGGCVGDTGAGCVAGELEFVLDVDPAEVGTNQSNHRGFNNSIGLRLGFDNSNKVGVTGAGPYETPTTGNPQDITTGVEFSIPLSQIGATTGGGPIKLTIFVGSGGFDHISNQFSGTGILLGNVGGPPFPSLELDYPGAQFVTVPNPGVGSGAAVPEPGSLALLVVGCLFAYGFARRK